MKNITNKLFKIFCISIILVQTVLLLMLISLEITNQSYKIAYIGIEKTAEIKLLWLLFNIYIIRQTLKVVISKKTHAIKLLLTAVCNAVITNFTIQIQSSFFQKMKLVTASHQDFFKLNDYITIKKMWPLDKKMEYAIAEMSKTPHAFTQLDVNIMISKLQEMPEMAMGQIPALVRMLRENKMKRRTESQQENIVTQNTVENMPTNNTFDWEIVTTIKSILYEMFTSSYSHIGITIGFFLFVSIFFNIEMEDEKKKSEENKEASSNESDSNDSNE